MDDFQAQIMAEITAHPVNFGEEIRLAMRRKWGLVLFIGLFVSGIIALALMWYSGLQIYQELCRLLIMSAGLSYVLQPQQVLDGIMKGMPFVPGLKTELGLLWGMFSGPILGVLSVFVVFRGYTPVSKTIYLNSHAQNEDISNTI
jgi:hypothetical protein